MSEGRGTRKVRLDVLLVTRGLAPTRSQAQALILAGRVLAGGRRLDKPGLAVVPDLEVSVAAGRRWVSRGGEKLFPALATFGVDVAGRDALDVGAGTGGFTQALLEAGAARVVAVDVGHGQFDWTLRNDPRVTLIEGLNARAMTPVALPCVPSVASVDVSFISLRQVLPAIGACLAPEAEVVALVKPQFEAGRSRVGAGGIVREASTWDDVLAGLVEFTVERGLGPAGLIRSAIAGAEGNVEFFLHLRPGRPADRAALDAARREAVLGGSRG